MATKIKVRAGWAMSDPQIVRLAVIESRLLSEQRAAEELLFTYKWVALADLVNDIEYAAKKCRNLRKQLNERELALPVKEK